MHFHLIPHKGLIHAGSGAGILLQRNDWKLFQFLQIQHSVFVLDKLPSRHKTVFYFLYLPDFKITVFQKRRTDYSEVNLSFL